MPAVNSSSYFYSVTTFILLPIWYGWLGGVLFDDGIKVMGMDVTANFIYFIFIIPSTIYYLLEWYNQQSWTCCLLTRYARKYYILVFDGENRDKNLKIKWDKKTYIYSGFISI